MQIKFNATYKGITFITRNGKSCFVSCRVGESEDSIFTLALMDIHEFSRTSKASIQTETER